MAARPRRADARVIIHFDYDCFYASVVENENPALKSLPLAIQQKQIIVTCNYEARRRGLHKLQLIREAKKVCPDVVIVVGEDLTRFRDASKDLYRFLQAFAWSGKVERLGFDEVWLDCTDMVEYNLPFVNHNDLSHSFFCLDKDDPTVGFVFDASTVYGPTYPPVDVSAAEASSSAPSNDETRLRLLLGSHLAGHLRHELEREKGYTAAVGIATNKLLSKLIGNAHKPNNQTTLLPPLTPNATGESSAIAFLDPHDIGKVPWIGFKLAQKIRARILGQTRVSEEKLDDRGAREAVTVRDVRLFPGMGPGMLEEILSGPGSQKGIGGRIWELINGVDETEVGKAKKIPTQISIENSYSRLDTFGQVRKELLMLSTSLLRRVHADLTQEDDMVAPGLKTGQRKWLAHPRTLRLSTRPRPPRHSDSRRARPLSRISRSVPLPNFVFNLNENDESLAKKLVQEALIPAFRKLHPEKSGWNLSLVNIAVTNITETATETKDSEGRDIGRMLKKQDEALKNQKVMDEELFSEDNSADDGAGSEVGATPLQPQQSDGNPCQDDWETDKSAEDLKHACRICGSIMPLFAVTAHDRYHSMAEW